MFALLCGSQVFSCTIRASSIRASSLSQAVRPQFEAPWRALRLRSGEIESTCKVGGDEGTFARPTSICLLQYLQQSNTERINMSGAQDAAIQAAETIQGAHIAHLPSVEHDVNPSTAASEKEPVRLNRSLSIGSVPDDIDEDEVPISLLRPTPRRPQMPPLPDLRFEQSYLASIKDAKDWKIVTYITIKDQVNSEA